MSNIEKNAFKLAKFLLENRQNIDQIEIRDSLRLSDEDFRVALKFLVDDGICRTAGQFGKGIIRQINLPKLQEFVSHLSSAYKEGVSDLMRNQVFISYSHKDKKWLKRLQVHLKPLERDGLIARWDDTMIDAGGDWRKEIRKAIASTKVAVLLITADFLASDFIANDELPPLLKAAESDGAVILPLIVSASRFEFTDGLSKFQTVNPPSLPLDRMKPAQREEVFVKLTTDIERALKKADTSTFIPLPLTFSTTSIVNADLSFYDQPPYGLQKFPNIPVPFQVENTCISMADVFDGSSKTFNLQEPILGVHAVHFLINAGDGRKSYGEVTIGFIEFIFKDDTFPQRFGVTLAQNIREWAIGNYVTFTIDGQKKHDPLVNSVRDNLVSHQVWQGRTHDGQVAVMDMLSVKIDETKQNKALTGIRFTRDIPREKYALSYFVSGITVERLNEHL
jgi:hypothetical protein